MKKLLILFFLTAFIACQSPAPDAVSEENQAKFEQQIESFRTFAKGFNAENMDLTMSVVSWHKDDSSWKKYQKHNYF